MRVVTGAADMGGADQFALGRIAPRMIGAADRAFDLFGFRDKDHAAMAADVLEHADLTLTVTDQQQRDAKEFYRLCVPQFWHIGSSGKTCPVGAEHGLFFDIKHIGVDVMGVGQPVGRFNRLPHRIKCLEGDVFCHDMRPLA